MPVTPEVKGMKKTKK
jgi:hypothetical protein